MQLVYDRRLADAGITGDQDEFRGAAVDDAIEGGEQALDLTSPTVKFLGNQEPVGRVVFAEREVVNPAPRLPSGQAAPKIILETSCCLVALLSGLGEQLS